MLPSSRTPFQLFVYFHECRGTTSFLILTSFCFLFVNSSDALVCVPRYLRHGLSVLMSLSHDGLDDGNIVYFIFFASLHYFHVV